MKIRISQPVAVFDAQSDESVTGAAKLRALDGLVYDREKVSDYFGGGDVDLDDIGVTGGALQLTFDAASGRLLVVCEFASPRKLKPKELKSLTAHCQGQWSDGIGEGIDGEWSDSHGVRVDFAPEGASKATTAEQIDDGVKVKPPRKSPLLAAAVQGDVARVRKLIAAGEPLDPRDKRGNTPLVLAILGKHVELAMLLIEAGADLQAQGVDGYGPLTAACMSCLETVAVALLDRGLEVDTRDGRGATPLMWAANRGCLTLAAILVERGADINAQDAMPHNEGHTALMYAQASRLDMVRYLLEHGADPCLKTKAGQTASQEAARNSHQTGWREKVALLEEAERRKRA